MFKVSLPSGTVNRPVGRWVHSVHLVTQWRYDPDPNTLFYKLGNLKWIGYSKTSKFPSHSSSLFHQHTTTPLPDLTRIETVFSAHKNLVVFFGSAEEIVPAYVPPEYITPLIESIANLWTLKVGVG